MGGKNEKRECLYYRVYRDEVDIWEAFSCISAEEFFKNIFFLKTIDSTADDFSFWGFYARGIFRE